MHRNATLSPMKRAPGYTVPMVPMHLAPMAPMHLVEQIRALTRDHASTIIEASYGSLEALPRSAFTQICAVDAGAATGGTATGTTSVGGCPAGTYYDPNSAYTGGCAPETGTAGTTTGGTATAPDPNEPDPNELDNVSCQNLAQIVGQPRQY